ncbi:MAG: hypothetical protein IPM07_20875 [Anaerolineales bacterium]|nr:hypothetical protein [Anaerolineales bacterium]
MQPLSAVDLLAVWEENWRQPPLRQGLALLAAAHPDESIETLAQMPMGRYNVALLMLRAWQFSPSLTAVTECPGCGELVEVTLDAPGLANRPPSLHRRGWRSPTRRVRCAFACPRPPIWPQPVKPLRSMRRARSSPSAAWRSR